MGVVIAAAITGSLSLIGVIVTVIAGNRKITTKMEISQAVTQEQIKNLGEEVRRHNNFAQRMPVVEEKVCNIERRSDAIERRLDVLEERRTQ